VNARKPANTIPRKSHETHLPTLEDPPRPCARLSGPHEDARRPRRGAWVGVLLPKRWARRAVTRNTIRRQIYAICRVHGASLPPAAHVVRLRSGFDPKVFLSATSVVLKRAVRTELEQLVERAARAAPATPP
jgi:ribonuclease P protein component